MLELNASDERGISIVRDKIKHFASLSVATTSATTTTANRMNQNSNSSNKKSKSTFFSSKDSTSNSANDENTAMDVENDPHCSTPNHNTKQYPNPPFKIIILDEADTVTPDAQAALRRIIVRGEIYNLFFVIPNEICRTERISSLLTLSPSLSISVLSNTPHLSFFVQEANSRVTRFILICNYVTRIIEPLASRCAKFRFQSLPIGSMKDRLQEICSMEQCPATVVSHLDDIIQYSDGDMRRAVTTLQSVHSIVTGATSNSTNSSKIRSISATNLMSSAMIAEIVGVPPDHVVNELWDTCIQSSYNVMHAGVENVIASGFSAQLLLSALLTRILIVPEEGKDDSMDLKYLDELSLALIAIRIAEAEKNMIDGADEYLQLMTVCSLIFTCYNKQQ